MAVDSVAVRGVVSTNVRRYGVNLRGFVRRSPFAAVWGLIGLIMILMAVGAPLITPKDPLEPNFTKMSGPPDGENYFGTDQIGRDLLSRILYGARISLFVALASVLIGTTIGGVWGLVSGYLGGLTDMISQRFVEIIMALPGLILAFALVLVLGAGMWTIILAIAVTRVPFGARIIRSVALTVKETAYVEAARGIGASQMRIMARHVAPQCVAPFLILFTVHLGTVIVIEASLSFLGLGVSPPTPTWGGMLGEASALLYPFWWHVFFPGVFITITVLAFNLFGDGLRDALDPRLRGTLE